MVEQNNFSLPNPAPSSGTFNPLDQPSEPSASKFLSSKWIIIGLFALIVIVGIILAISSMKNSASIPYFNKNLSTNLSTCAAQLGNKCSSGYVCNGTWLMAQDTNACCNGNCMITIPNSNNVNNESSKNVSNKENQTGPIFCEREKPSFDRYFEWVFFTDINSITDSDRKQIWWIKDSETERKEYMEDYEIIDGNKHYFNRLLTLYDKNNGNNTKSYIISQEDNGQDSCIAGHLQYYKGLTEQKVYENEVSNITLSIGGKTCYMLKTPRVVGGGPRSLDCINKDLCEFMIDNLLNTGEKIATIKLDNAEIPSTIFNVPSSCAGN